VKITNKEYVPVLETEHVLKFIRFSKNLISIPEAEIEIIKRVVGEGIEVEIEQGNRYKEGDEVEIVAGNLLGLKGRLISINGKKQMLVELENMGYSLRMEVEPSLLKKLNQISV
jgi:transcription antitermination factor NusG